jgi:dihydrofolate synthase / folylpolyglutamate synthase
MKICWQKLMNGWQQWRKNLDNKPHKPHNIGDSSRDPVQRIEAYQRFGSILGLSRMTRLMDGLGNPQDKLKYIHVAGTNGKGSVCRYLYEVLLASGYSVGLYTSPFLEEFRERIEMDHEMIPVEGLDRITDLVIGEAEQMVSEGLDSPTEFEIVTAIAFVYFAEKMPDFVLLEVGLGGKGDSTNIIKNPLISVITSIGHDHMDRLGNTLTAIAAEKAGIIKPGVPIVIQVADKEAARVIARVAYEKRSPILDAGKLKPTGVEITLSGTRFELSIAGIHYHNVEISMAGEHQVKNAITALAAIELLRKSSIIKIDQEGLCKGMKAARVKGRFEILGSNPCFILDGAHNREGVEALIHAVDRHFFGKKILYVVGILADKEVDMMVDCMAAYGAGSGFFIATEPNNPRKLPAASLCAAFRSRGCECIEVPHPKDALARAKEMSPEFDAVLFTGSLYMIGEIRKVLHEINN